MDDIKREIEEQTKRVEDAITDSLRPRKEYTVVLSQEHADLVRNPEIPYDELEPVLMAAEAQVDELTENEVQEHIKACVRSNVMRLAAMRGDDLDDPVAQEALLQEFTSLAGDAFEELGFGSGPMCY